MIAPTMNVLVDTSVWIDYFRGVDAGHIRALERALNKDNVLLPDLTLAELLLGVPTEAVATRLEQQLEAFELADIGGHELSIVAARNYRILRSKGITIRSTIDLLIGTWCIETNAHLLHNDRDYAYMQQHLGLQCVPTDLFQ